MTDVRAFRGVRFDPRAVGSWGDVLGPPYDIITEKEAATLRASHPNQITKIESASGEANTAAAASLFESWRNSGVLVQDDAPSYYLAEHSFQHDGRAHARTTLYGAVRLTPWDSGEVLPHEWTMPGPREERSRLRRTVGADISPLMGLLPDRSGTLEMLITQALESDPLVSGRDYAGETHTLWVIDDSTSVEAIRSTLAADTIYMADGHHRYEAALANRATRAAISGSRNSNEPDDFVLMGLIVASEPSLLLGGTHRVVHVPLPDEIGLRLAEHFTVSDLGPGSGRSALNTLLGQMTSVCDDGPTIGAIGLGDGRAQLLLSGEAARVAMPASVPASWSTLDAALLQYIVLEPMLGIDGAARAQGEAVTYTHDAELAHQLVANGSASVAFFLNPPSLEEIFASADAGDRMPQKSTYFTPKLPTGLVMHCFR